MSFTPRHSHTARRALPAMTPVPGRAGASTTRADPKALSRYQVFDLHRFIALLALCFTLLHVFIVLPDDFIGFSLPELLLPFASAYRPFYMALGMVSLYLLALTILSFYLRPLVPYSLWRYLHYGTFGVFSLALAHGLGSGTDTHLAWAQALYGLSGGIVLLLLVRRAWKGGARGLIRQPTPVAPDNLDPSTQSSSG